ncbi:hypothetical protein E5720_18035 [Rhodococcus sp. PAMC28707]|nr:hypothetical protein E5769_17490 [Rhodococcus sp. PAMC28705]QCB60096.1 hypothetical protein E5720_18035 [Rhodococcus sp. PAMC28707]
MSSLRMRSSLDRIGACGDNSMTESLFVAFKKECVYQTLYVTKGKARQDIIKYIGVFYNPRRRDSSVGYRTPNDVHRSYEQSAIAA